MASMMHTTKTRISIYKHFSFDKNIILLLLLFTCLRQAVEGVKIGKNCRMVKSEMALKKGIKNLVKEYDLGIYDSTIVKVAKLLHMFPDFSYEAEKPNLMTLVSIEKYFI